MDIVEKLRIQAASDEAAGTLYSHTVAIEAADTIEKLRKDTNRYRHLRDNSTSTWIRFQDQWQMTPSQCDDIIDRELLEAAAKAAGIEYGTKRSPTGSAALYLGPSEGWWNPLIDDGDALRLAVKVLNWPHGGRAFGDQVASMYAVGKLPRDPYEATRRAIVRAAAAMVKNGVNK